MSKPRVNVTLGATVFVARDQIRQSVLSVPASSRLKRLRTLVGVAPKNLPRALKKLGIDLDDTPPDDLSRAMDRLADSLSKLPNKPVWLVPSIFEAKWPYEDHLEPLLNDQPSALLAFGARDGYQNAFKPLSLDGQLLCRPLEPVNRRAYAAIYSTAEDHLGIGRAVFRDGQVKVEGRNQKVRWAYATTPLIWDGEVVPLPIRLAYQSDLRHEIHIPPSRWATDHAELQAMLFQPGEPEELGQAVMVEAAKRGLRQETGYYLSSVGVTRSGDLVLVTTHGSLASLAEHQRLHQGADVWRAVVTEEGGSCGCALLQCKKDYGAEDSVLRRDGKIQWESSPQFFGTSTYFRNKALALIVLRLRDFVVEAPFREEAPCGFDPSLAG